MDNAALDRAWEALVDHDPGFWIEGYIWRKDQPDELTRALIKAVVDAYSTHS